jgi:hypothetical protein
MTNYTVDTDGTSGDYASLNAAIAAIDNSALSDDVTITCYATDSDDDTTQVVMDEIDTTTDYRLYIKPGDDNYRLRVDLTTLTAAITFDRQYGHTYNVTFEGLNIVSHSHGASYRGAFYFFNLRDSGELQILGCTIEDESNTERSAPFHFTTGGSDPYTHQVVIVNNFVITNTSSTSSASSFFRFSYGAPNVALYNNTFVAENAAAALYFSSDAAYDANTVWYNNLFENCKDSYNSYEPGTADYNVFDAAVDLGGANDQQSQTFTFEDAANGDYHLDSTDTGAMGNGTDLSSDGTYAFDDDVDGDTRSDWDCGADEYVSGGGATNTSAWIAMMGTLTPQYTGLH